MNILYFTNVRFPTERAHGLQIAKTCEALAHLGSDVSLVVPKRSNVIKEDPIRYYSISVPFKVTFEPIIDALFLMRFGRGLYTKFTTFIFSIVIYLQYRKKNSESTIVYTRDESLLPVLQRVFSRVYWECHTIPSHPALYLKTWNKASGIICISKGLREALQSLGVHEDRITVVPDSVNLAAYQDSPDKAQLRNRLNLPVDKKIVLYTGHLFDWKGADYLAQAAALSEDDGSIQYVFIGGTDDDVERFKKNYGDIKAVHILGAVPHEDIAAYQQAADVLVLPNSAKKEISRKFTSPLKLFEYMASGVPIVAVDIPSIREIVDDRMVTLVKPDDEHALAKGITDTLRDPQSRDRAERARVKSEKYSWTNRAHAILEFIKRRNA